MDPIKALGSSKASGFPDNSRESLASSLNRGKEAVSAAASDAMDAGAVDLKALQTDLNDLKETVAQLISRASNETAKSAREIAGQVSTAASDMAERATNVVSPRSKPRALPRSWRTSHVAIRLALSRAQ